MAERDRERSDSTVVMDKTVEPCPFLKRFAGRFANNDKHAGQHLQLIARTPEFFHTTFDIGVERARVGEVTPGREDDFGCFSRELPARVRRAGLYDNRPALNGTCDVEWPAYFQKLPLVVQNVQLPRIKI